MVPLPGEAPQLQPPLVQGRTGLARAHLALGPGSGTPWMTGLVSQSLCPGPPPASQWPALGSSPGQPQLRWPGGGQPPQISPGASWTACQRPCFLPPRCRRRCYSFPLSPAPTWLFLRGNYHQAIHLDNFCKLRCPQRCYFSIPPSPFSFTTVVLSARVVPRRCGRNSAPSAMSAASPPPLGGRSLRTEIPDQSREAARCLAGQKIARKGFASRKEEDPPTSGHAK
mmetsp:Transcript_31275/g.64000  ORF Transcript_31275/g.64000 Transcript_31275/m.64000 type:complete len:226 (+) Transcript_31275:787-1464(+)